MHRPSSLARLSHACIVAALAAGLGGCASLFDEGAATAAGIGGTAIASKVTNNATVAAGIGLGVLAGAQAGVKAVERNYHGEQQDQIAEVAGALQVGEVGHWQSRHAIQLEPDQAGKVTVSRVISASELNCKEIVFSVDETKKDAPPLSSF